MFLMLPITEDMQRAHANAIRAAILRSYPTVKAACIDMEVGANNFDKELTGERPINYTRLMKLDARFWRWLPIFLVKSYGMPEELETAERLDVGARRMARMDVANVPQQRTRTA